MGGALILHNPFGGGGVSNDQEAGGPYKNTGTVALMAGDITLQTMGVPPGVITMPGPIVNMGPAELNLTTGFPWTTGRVQVTNPTATTIAPPSGTMSPRRTSSASSSAAPCSRRRASNARPFARAGVLPPFTASATVRSRSRTSSRSYVLPAREGRTPEPCWARDRTPGRP